MGAGGWLIAWCGSCTFCSDCNVGTIDEQAIALESDVVVAVQLDTTVSVDSCATLGHDAPAGLSVHGDGMGRLEGDIAIVRGHDDAARLDAIFAKRGKVDVLGGEEFEGASHCSAGEQGGLSVVVAISTPIAPHAAPKSVPKLTGRHLCSVQLGHGGSVGDVEVCRRQVLRNQRADGSGSRDD